MEQGIDVSICIVNWNTRDLLRRCLRSIIEKTSGVTYEIIVFDNSSSDGSAAMVRTEFPGCRLVESPLNLGFVRGNNIAVRKATGEFILYLNPDTVLLTNAVGGLAGFLRENRGYGAAGCRILNVDGTVQKTCAGTWPTPFRELCRYLFLNRIFPTVPFFSARELDYWDHEDSREVDCLSGACMMVRRDLVENLDGFDQNLFMYSEDLDLCFRIRQSGSRIYFLASEIIVHREGSATERRSEPNFAPLMQKESNYYFLRKNFGRTTAAEYRAVTGIGAVVRIVIALVSAPVLIGRHTFGIIFRKHLALLRWALGLITPLREGYAKDATYAG